MLLRMRKTVLSPVLLLWPDGSDRPDGSNGADGTNGPDGASGRYGSNRSHCPVNICTTRKMP